MTRLRIWCSRLLGQFSKRRFEEELDQEVQFHLEMLKSEHGGKGVNDETARLMAQIVDFENFRLERRKHGAVMSL